MSKATFTEVAAPSTPDSGKVALYAKSDGLLYSKDDAGSETLVSGGAGGGSAPFVDSTAIIKGSADATKLLRIEVDGLTTATTRVLTPPNYDGTIATLAGTETLTNKTIDADGTGNVITNIGSSEIKAEIVTGLTADASPDGAADYVMTYDNSATALKKVLLNNLPRGISYAILRDEKSTGTNGGSSSATTWNNRNLNTETYDPNNIVSIASNQFTPIAGDYILEAAAVAYKVNQNRLRLYNVTGAVSVEEGLNHSSNTADATLSTVTLCCKFTANGTDAYRIDHYTAVAQATNGLGVTVGDGSNEVYLEIQLKKVA